MNIQTAESFAWILVPAIGLALLIFSLFKYMRIREEVVKIGGADKLPEFSALTYFKNSFLFGLALSLGLAVLYVIFISPYPAGVMPAIALIAGSLIACLIPYLSANLLLRGSFLIAEEEDVLITRNSWSISLLNTMLITATPYLLLYILFALGRESSDPALLAALLGVSLVTAILHFIHPRSGDKNLPYELVKVALSSSNILLIFTGIIVAA
ncbi:MAG: hypothetical protein V1843_04415, partial [bacterium]